MGFLPTAADLLDLPPSGTGESWVALLHQGAGSTIDHFLRGPFERAGVRLVEIDSALPPEPVHLLCLQDCSSIVVVRYLPRAWQGPLAKLRSAGARLVYLMDDDLLDQRAHVDLPRDYRRRLWQRITRYHRRLPRLVDLIWVTSDYLASKYAHLCVRQLALAPHASLLAMSSRLQIAYLGTSVHTQEFEWLLPLLRQLQLRHSSTHIELFGDLQINRQFRELPRVRVLHPMQWPNYLAETGHARIDILLTPLLQGAFNAARAPVKLIDAARSGAAGLYSNRPPYRGFVRHGDDGLLLDDRHESWLMAIDRLIADPGERRRLAQGARRRALELCSSPGP